MGRILSYLRGNWRWLAFFAVLFSAAGVVWVYLDPGQPDQPRQHHLEAEIRDYQPGGAACRPEGLERLSVQKAAANREGCEEAAEEHRLKQNDLVQQTRSADAAEDMAGFSYVQTRALAVAALLGLLTLAAASVAAYFAREAAKHTKTGSGTAEETLAHMKRQAAMEARPWLVVENIDSETMVIDAADNTGQLIVLWTARIGIKNIGKLPAERVSLRWVLFNQDTASLSDLFGPEVTTSVKFLDVVVPGDVKTEDVLTIIPLDDVFDGGSIGLGVKVSYSSLNGKTVHDTIQRWVIARSVFKGTPQGYSRDWLKAGARLESVAVPMVTHAMT